MEYVTKDSGERQQFATGAVRDTQDGKPRYDLIPPMALRRVAMLYARGAEKYGDNNWQKGILASRCIASMLRHAFSYIIGDRDEDHLAAVIFNAFCIMHYEDMVTIGKGDSSLLDLPDYTEKSHNGMGFLG